MFNKPHQPNIGMQILVLIPLLLTTELTPCGKNYWHTNQILAIIYPLPSFEQRGIWHRVRFPLAIKKITTELSAITGNWNLAF